MQDTQQEINLILIFRSFLLNRPIFNYIIYNLNYIALGSN